ncbi:MAG: dephospho-CoA kinase [Tannerellaceae bacterium]|nr:dephospho-CoA kinase [Tannerellaceae bacterium]
MIKVGITGGIGSGKSTVAHIFQILGYPVYVADKESKRLTETSPLIRKQLEIMFGKEIFVENRLNKPLLANYIFNNKDLLSKVNSVIHPVVLNDFLKWVKHQKSNLVLIESALLFESGFNTKIDKSLIVYAPEEIRTSRVMKRDNLTKDEIRKRMNNQLSDKMKCKLSDLIIYNTGKEALIPQINKILKSLNEKP